MQFVTSLIQGLLIGIGVMLGMLLSITVLMNKASKSEGYDPEELKIGFQDLLHDAEREEKYEYLEGIKTIIGILEKGALPNDLTPYNIRKQVTLWIQHKNDERMGVNIGRKYIITIK